MVKKMRVFIADKDWKYIYETDGYYPIGIPNFIVDNFIDAVSFLESMKDMRDIYSYPWFDPKKKHGKQKDHRWIRLNRQRRLLFRQDKTTDPITIVIDYVSDRHYE